MKEFSRKLLLAIIFLSFYNMMKAQDCNEVIPAGAVSVSINGATVTFNNAASASGTHQVEYMFIVYDGPSQQYINTGLDPTLTYTFVFGGIQQEVQRCVRYVACGGAWQNETTPLFFDVFPPCNPLSDGGVITGDETVCASSYDPGIISNYLLPSLINPSVEFYWETSTDGVNFTPDWYATGEFYDPPTITQTTYYRRMARNVNCTAFIPSNVVVKTIQPMTAPTISASQPICNDNIGSINITSPLGANYSYSKDGVNFQPSSNFANLSPGQYPIVVKNNNNGCVSNPINTILNPDPNAPTAPVVTSTVSGCITPTGSLEVTSPLTAGNTYSIDNVNYQSSPLFSNLGVGTYTVKVKNATGCNSIPTIASVGYNAVTPVLSVVQPTCTNALGSITITSPTGVGYLYSKDGVNYQSSNIFNLVAVGNYTVYAKDPITDCIATTTTSIVSYSGAPAPPTVSVIQPTCAVPTGTITVTSPIGSFFYSYSLDGGAMQGGVTFSGLQPGIHTITMSSLFATCLSSTAVVINSLSVTPTISGDSNTCVGGNNITLVGTPAGGSWTSSDPLIASVNASSGEITGNASGTCIVTYSFNNGCGLFTATKNIYVNPLPTQPTCSSIILCPNVDATSSVMAVVSPAGGNITWNTGDATTATSYTYSLSNSCGTVSCTNTIQRTSGSVGNYVWLDLNRNGINDEPSSNGINGVDVELWNATTNTLIASTTTANDGSSNPGYYNFVVCSSGDYKVKFPTTNSGNNLTTQTSTSATDNNSDANNTTGESPVFTIDISGTSVAKDNMTIDAGYQEPAKACLGNYVFNDINHDGIQDANEVGVSGVTVSLLNGASNAIMATLTTDAYGYYQFCGLTAGDYKVKFSLPTNYIFTGQNAPNDATDSDPNIFTGITDLVTLAPGDSNMTVDAGIFQPQPITATVGDRVWFDVNGNGIQDIGESGVSGITVTLYNCANPNVPIATTVTDAGGNYLFEDVVAGSYNVGFTVPIGMVFTTQSGNVSDALNSDVNVSTERTACFNVVSGDHITYVDAGIKPKLNSTSSIGDKVWNDANQDGIQDPTETGVQGVTVTLYAADGVTQISTTTTDGLGNYGFNGIAPGCYIVGFTNPMGYAFSPQNAIADSSKNSDANTTTGMTNLVCVAAGENNPTIDAGIYNNANTNSIGDLVWYDENHNGLQDATEYGYPGVVVTLYDCATNAIVATTTTNASGNYLFDGIANGTYFVGFGFVAGYQFTGSNSDAAGIFGANNSDVNPSNGFTSCVSLIGNTDITTIDAGIYPGSKRNATSSLGDIVWTDANNNGIQDNGETGVPNVNVNLYDQYGVNLLASTVTDGLGNYIFTNLLGGIYKVEFTNIPAGYTFTTQSGNIDDETNSDANATTGMTDVIILGLGEDKMTVDAGIVAPTNTVCLGDYVWIDLDNDGLQEIGEPAVPGVTVKLYDNNTNTVLQVATTNSEGKYMFCGLTNGSTYSVGFENLPAGFTFTTSTGTLATTDNSDANPTTGRTTTVTMGATNDLTLDAGIYSATTAVVGNYVWYDEDADGIQDATEAPISGVLVTLYNSSNIPVASAVTDARGGYLFTNVTPGDYTIGFAGYPSTLVPTTKGLDANAGDDSNVDPITGKTESFNVPAGSSNLTLDAGFKANPIAGLGNYVWLDLDEDGLQNAGEPGVSGVIVSLYAADGTTLLATAITDGNGAYSFPNLTAGSYIVGFSNLPVGASKTKIVGSLNDGLNSDMGADNKTSLITLTAGNYNPNIDAGIYFGTPLGARELRAINAVVNTNGIECSVNWYTTDEMNTEYFEIERSINGREFETVSTKSASKNTVGKTNYNFQDDISKVETSSVIYYRIKLNDIDGKQTLSNVVTTRKMNKDQDVSVRPVPFTDKVTIDFASTEASNVILILTDLSGSVIRQQNYEVAKGVSSIQLTDLNSLPTGTYFIKMIDENTQEVFVRKINK